MGRLPISILVIRKLTPSLSPKAETEKKANEGANVALPRLVAGVDRGSVSILTFEALVSAVLRVTHRKKEGFWIDFTLFLRRG